LKLEKAEYDMFHFVKNLDLKQRYTYIKKFAREILDAISYIHEKGIAHNDLKLENIFLFKNMENKLIAKIADFGLARNQNLQENNNKI
jgi:serine/threonine protein kinase